MLATQKTHGKRGGASIIRRYHISPVPTTSLDPSGSPSKGKAVDAVILKAMRSS